MTEATVVKFCLYVGRIKLIVWAWSVP